MKQLRGYQDPFTGGARYIPGGGGGGANNGNIGNLVDPFTGASSYRTAQAQEESSLNSRNVSTGSTIPTGVRHFPHNKCVTFDICDSAKVLNKLM